MTKIEFLTRQLELTERFRQLLMKKHEEVCDIEYKYAERIERVKKEMELLEKEGYDDED